MTVFLLFLCFFGTGIGLLVAIYGTIHNKKKRPYLLVWSWRFPRLHF